MKPSIDVVKNLAETLDITVALLLGETEDDNLLKDHDMITRLKAVEDFTTEEKSQFYFTLDAII